MKKSLIFITVISLLITLFIPDIALAQDCTVSVERGYAGEETTVTGKVAGWTDDPSAINVWLWLDVYNIDTDDSIYKYFSTNDITADPFIGSFSVNLPAGNYIASIDGTVYYGDENYYDCGDKTVFVVEERPAPEPEPDTTPPVITLIGDETVNLIVGDTYEDAGATALDDVDGDITANIVVGGDVVDTTTAGTYTITYNVSDAAENPAEEVTRTVIVNEPEPIIPEPIIPEPCYCSLIVQIRDEAGHPINGAVFKVDGIEKKTVNGDARWDNLECDTSYEVREISPEKKTEGIHLGDCGERSTLRIVNKIEEEVVEEVVEEVIIPEAGLDFNFTALYAIAGLGILRILLGIERKRK